MIPKLTEKHVQNAVVQFLEMDGWRAIRTDPVSDRRRGKGFGEIGMPDYLFLRYTFPRWGLNDHFDTIRLPDVEVHNRSCILHLWIEFKAPSGKLASHQLRWHQSEGNRGAVVLTVHSFDGFREWYMLSGLNQRMRRPGTRDQKQ